MTAGPSLIDGTLHRLPLRRITSLVSGGGRCRDAPISKSPLEKRSRKADGHQREMPAAKPPKTSSEWTLDENGAVADIIFFASRRSMGSDVLLPVPTATDRRECRPASIAEQS